MKLNGKTKLNTNQNLIPNKLIYQYLYQKTLFPAIILVISLIVLSVGLYFGCKSLTDFYTNQAAELAAQDLSAANANATAALAQKEKERDELQNEYDHYRENNPPNVVVDDSILKVLNDEIVRLKAELEALNQQPDEEPTVDVAERYHIDELLLYIDKIRTQNVIIISLEDERSASSNSSNHLVYIDDVGNAGFSLHGMATSATELSRFMMELNNCEYIAYTKIVSVETQAVSGRSLYVFEMIITPKVD